MKRILAMILAALLLFAAAGCGADTSGTVKTGGSVKAQAEASYPEDTEYPSDAESNWESLDRYYDTRYSYSAEGDYQQSVQAFSKSLLRTALTGVGNDSMVLSPANIYMALAMLAETTDGNTRSQLLDLLGEDSIESLRSDAKDLWGVSYRDDGITTLTLGSSVWLRDGQNFNADTLKQLAETFMADCYSGRMGSEEMNEALQSWLNAHTGNMLEEYTSEESFTEETVAALATAVYLKAPWVDSFYADMTESGTFTAADGSEQTADFMTETGDSEAVWFCDGFTAVYKPLKDVGNMWFILPDEGTTIDDVVAGDDLYDLLSDPWSKGCTYYRLTVTVPKFDVSSGTDLIDTLRKLGVTDVLDPKLSDFTPLTDEDGIALTSASHAARLKIDEDGVEAAAYTLLAVTDTAIWMENEAYEFRADRPFLAVVANGEGAMWFAAAVNSIG